jgi:phage-related protein
MRTPPDDQNNLKPLRFLDAAKDDLMDIPVEVRQEFGYGLYLIQRGEMPDNASPFEGSTGANIMKLVERHDTDTYRCVFTVKFEKAVFVLHVFKKKSTHGKSTPQREIETVKARFQRAQELYIAEFGVDT